MNMSPETIEKIAPYIQYALPLIQTYLLPKLNLAIKDLKKKDESKFQDVFNEYLCRTIEKCSIINTLIFPNHQIKIEDIYQPLTINDESDNKAYKINKYPIDLFKKYKRILVRDSAGMGKSTLSKYICLKVITEKRGIPVFIELRRLHLKHGILDEIYNQINDIDEVIDKTLIKKLLKKGNFIFILDGYDEIAEVEREKVTQQIKDFISKCEKNDFLLSSRPEEAITSFGDFKLTNIQNLTNKEANQLLGRFDNIAKRDLSDSLINEVKTNNKQAKEFMHNPFLISLLYKTFSFKKNIPSKKSTFYNDVYTALFQEHDLSKEYYKRDKKSGLDIQDFRSVLRELAWFSFRKGEIEYSKIRAIEYVKECKKNLSSIVFNENSFIDDLLTTVPLFIKNGNDIKWAHKSMQDYFTAEYIVYDTRKVSIVNRLIEKDILKYENVFTLIMELDSRLIRLYILPDILQSLINHFNKNKKIDNIDSKESALRSLLTYRNKVWYGKQEDFTLSSDIFEHFVTYFKKKGIEVNYMTIFIQDFFVVEKTSEHAMLLQLLGINGVLGKSIFKPSISLSESIDVINEKISDDELIELSDVSSNCIHNNPKYYKHVNRLVTGSSKFRVKSNQTFIPNIDYCKQLLDEIEEEKKRDKDLDF